MTNYVASSWCIAKDQRFMGGGLQGANVSSCSLSNYNQFNYQWNTWFLGVATELIHIIAIISIHCIPFTAFAYKSCRLMNSSAPHGNKGKDNGGGGEGTKQHFFFLQCRRQVLHRRMMKLFIFHQKWVLLSSTTSEPNITQLISSLHCLPLLRGSSTLTISNNTHSI